MTQTREQLVEDLHAAKVAKRLRNDFLGDFFKEREAAIIDFIKNLQLGEDRALKEAHHQLKSMATLEDAINTLINTGKMAELDISRLDNKLN